MTMPIEMGYTLGQDMFSGASVFAPMLGAKTHEQFVEEGQKLRCTNCNLGCHEVNVGLPPVLCGGNYRGRVIFIGEGPGQTERELHTPFIGRSGVELKKMIDASRLPREACYFMNLVKCRPCDRIVDPKTPEKFRYKDYAPNKEQSEACRPLLLKQLSLLRPGVIVFVGGVPAMQLLGLTVKFKITKYIGYGVPIYLEGESSRVCTGICIPHPSYFLHNPSESRGHYADTASVLAGLNFELYHKRPVTFHALPEDLFFKKQWPLAYEHKMAKQSRPTTTYTS